MNKSNMRKNALSIKSCYLTAKERKIVEWYESKRLQAKIGNDEINAAK
ncbi:hypothetical protein [Bacillus sp. USDA818B3_A]|nr:hypothetical protein [Bacillus sp. USDA818B3_A]